MQHVTFRNLLDTRGGVFGAGLVCGLCWLLCLPGLAQAQDGAADSLDRALRLIAASNIGPAPDVAPAPTGDALFDRYAQLVDQQILALPLAPAPEQAAAVGLVPDTQLAQWAGEFGSDPRYWELRYFCAKCDDQGGALAGGFTAAQDFLAEAQRRGVASANTLQLLASEMRVQFGRELDAAGGGTAELMQQQDDALLAQLDAAIAADTGQAWSYYARALFRFGQGDPDLGLDDLRAGNAAQHCRYPQPWPLSSLALQPASEKPLGSAAVWGAVRLTAQGYPLPNFIRIKESLKEAQVAANLGAGVDDMEPWHQFACRFGVSTPDVMIYGAVASSLESMLIGYAEETAAYTAAQVETLQRSRQAVYAMRGVMRGRGMQDWVLPQVVQLTSALGSRRGLFLMHYVDLCDEVRHSGVLGTIFAELSAVHYPEFAITPELLKYEPRPAPEE